MASATNSAGPNENYAYDGVGNRTASHLSASYSYQAFNELTSTAPSTYTYDNNGNLISRTDGSGTTTFGYDEENRLKQVTLPTGLTVNTSMMPSAVAFNAVRPPAQTIAANTLADFQYQFNAVNNITQMIDEGGSHSYTYDPLDRLTAATHPNQTNESYSYDDVGNRTASHQGPNYTYQAFNRLVAANGASFGYDANGNLISKADSSGSWTYAWDYENRLKQASRSGGVTVTYAYDALGRRIQRTSSAGTDEKFVHDGQDVLLDLNSSLDVTTSYLNGLGIDDHLRQTNATTGVSYYLTDYLGSTSALTDASGTVVEQLSYDSFGNNSGSIRTRYTYTGREFDSDAALYYYRARSYDPQTGRFVSEDSIGLKSGFNLYAYTENDPVNGFDPFGEDVIAIFDRRKGTLTVTDRQTGKKIVIKRVFSGYRGCSNNPSCDAIKDTGPVPAGDYLIGNSYVPEKHQGQAGDYNWYRLYGPNGRGGYSYTDVPVRSANGKTVIRGGFNLHTGSYSEGCVTVESDTSWWNPFSTYPQRDAYSQLRQMLDNTAPLAYKGSNYRGKLSVK